MGELLPLIDSGSAIAGIKDDIAAIEGIVALAKKWKTPEWPVDAPSLDALLTNLIATANDASVVTLFGKLGLAGVQGTIVKLLTKVQAQGEKIPDWVKTLLTRTGSIDGAGALAWKPLDKDESFKLGSEYTLGLSASFQLSCAAADTWDVWGDGKLLHVAVDGSLGATGDATLPFGKVTVSAGVKANASLGLGYYFDISKTDTLYVVALAERLVRLPDPFDYGSVWKACQQEDFAGVAFDFAASAGGHVEVALAALGLSAGGLQLDLSAKIRVAADFSRGFTLTLKRGAKTGDSFAVVADLHRSELSSSALGITIGVTADLPVLRGKVQDLLKKALKAWDKELAELRPFLSPGTYLRGLAGDQLKKVADDIVSDADLRTAIEADLERLTGRTPGDGSSVSVWLQDAIKGAIDSRSKDLWKAPQTVVDGVMADLAKVLPADAADAVKAKVQGLVDQAKDGLKAAADALVAKYALPDLGKWLGSAGAAVNSAVKDADDLLARFRDILDKYNTLIHEVAAKAQEAAEKKITLSIFAQNKRSRELDVKINATFTDNGPAAADAFRLLTRGKIPDLLGLFGPGVGLQGVTLSKDSAYSEHLTLEGSGGYEVVLFGFGAKRTEEISVDAKATVDVDGNVQIDTFGKLTARFSGGGEEREVGFVDVLSLAIAGAKPDDRPSITRTIKLGVTVGYNDPKYTAKKLNGFLSDLEKPAIALIPPAKGAAARALLAGWQDAAGKADAQISAQLWIAQDKAQALLRIAPGMRDPAGVLLRATRVAVYNIGLDALAQVGDIARDKMGNDAKRVYTFLFQQQLYEKPRSATLADEFLDYAPKLIEAVLKDEAMLDAVTAASFKTFRSTQKRLVGLAELIERAGIAYQSTPTIDPADPDKWTLDDYFDAQDGIARASRNWLAVNQVLIFFTDDGVHPHTLAFMLALEALAGGLDTPVTLTMTNYKDPENPVVEAV